MAHESSSFADRLFKVFQTAQCDRWSSTFSHFQPWPPTLDLVLLREYENFVKFLRFWPFFDHRKKHFVIIVKSAQFIGALIMSEDRDQSSSLIESDNDSEPAVQHQMNPRVEAKINALCAQTGLIMKQVKPVKVIWGHNHSSSWGHFRTGWNEVKIFFRKMDRGNIRIQKWLDRNQKRERKYSLANYHVIFLKMSLFLFSNNMDRKF